MGGNLDKIGTGIPFQYTKDKPKQNMTKRYHLTEREFSELKREATSSARMLSYLIFSSIASIVGIAYLILR